MPGEIATPWFQINFLPDLMQVYFLALTVLVAPTLVHLVPAIVAPFAGVDVERSARERTVTSNEWRRNCIERGYPRAFSKVNS